MTVCRQQPEKKRNLVYFIAIFFQHFIYTQQTRKEIFLWENLLKGFGIAHSATTNESGRGKRPARAVDTRRTRIQNFTCRMKSNMFQRKRPRKSAATLTGSVLSAAALTAITWIHAQTAALQKRNLNETTLKCGSRKRKRNVKKKRKKKNKKHLLRKVIQKSQEILF